MSRISGMEEEGRRTTTGGDPAGAGDRPGWLLERRLEVLSEIERLDSEHAHTAGGVAKALCPALLFAVLAPLIWSPPLWIMFAGPLLLMTLGLLYLLSTGEVRTSRETWRRIQRLKRELAFLDSFARLQGREPRDPSDLEALEAIHRILEGPEEEEE